MDMTNGKNLPSTSTVLSKQPNLENTVIDLTDDYELEPSIKKIALSSPRNGALIDENEPSTSGNSTLRKHKKPVACSKCGGGQVSTGLVNLECKHCLCYECLIISLRKNHETIDVCPVLRCQKQLSDQLIKNALFQQDYINYLEHSRAILRKALLARELNGYEDTEETIIEGVIEVNDEAMQIENLSNQDQGFVDQEPGSVVNKCREVIEIEDLVRAEIQFRRNSELLHLQNLDAESYVKNADAFECPICFSQQGIGEGVSLKNCLHSFCIECLSETINHADDPTVICPYNSELGTCEFPIQEREIRALVSAEIYEKHLATGLKRAQTNLENVFHCKLPDCIGFVVTLPDNIAFICPVCQKVNCIPCKAIHEEKTCEQHQDDLINDQKNQQELKLTEEAVKKMIESGEVSFNYSKDEFYFLIYLLQQAMLCPNCDAVIQKDEGCDFVQCGSCKLGICYITKKPRIPLNKTVNGVKVVIDGCHCREKKNKKCHVQCRNCH